MSATPVHVLRQHHRRQRGTLLVWALGCGLAAALCQGAALLGWWTHATLPSYGLAAVTLVCLAVWWRRARRLTREATARNLDAEWQLSARLESSQELSAQTTPFAQALHHDAASHIGSRHARPAPWWHGGLTLVALALLLCLVELSVFGWRLLSAPVVEQPADLPADISAAIEWRKPDAEIKATAIEEIPLVAETTTATGFTAVTLEVSINGAPVLSRPLEPDTLAPLAKPGTHPIELSLYLDEIEAHPFDIVSYHLRAERRLPAALAKQTPPPAAITSPLQFIQIRPAREDAEIVSPLLGPEKPFVDLLVMLGSIKAAQLSLLKQNFLLAHAQLARTDPVWTEENTRVAADQRTFADKVAEIRDFAINEELPVLIVDNLGQVIPLAKEASEHIAKTANETAVPLQGRSLGLITEIEKLIRLQILDLKDQIAKQGKPLPKNPDPFKDEQRYDMPARTLTAAGQLEQMSEQQQEQTKENEKAPDGSPKQQQAAQKQADLADKLAKLAEAKKLSGAAQRLAEQAARDAKKAASQLKQNDGAAARSPAAAAEQALSDAVKAQEKAGRDAALAQLDAARRAMNEAARIPDNAARAAALEAIAEQLRKEAFAQQETGSEKAARQLLEAAKQAHKAAEAARNGTDQTAPKDAAGKEPGDRSGEQKPGTQPGDQVKGTQPGQRDPGASGTAEDPKGSDTAPAPGQGKDQPGPGETPTPKDQSSGEGEGSGSGPRPDPDGDQPRPDQQGDQTMLVPVPGGEQPGAKGEQPGQTGPGGPGSTAKQPRPDPNGQQIGPGLDPSTAKTPTGAGEGEGTGPGPSNHPGQAPGATPLENAVDTAAQAEIALAGYRASLEKALRQLQGSGSGQGENASATGNGSGQARMVENTRLAAQTAAQLLQNSEANGLRRKIEDDLRRFDATGNVVMPPDLSAAIERLRLLLTGALGTDRRDETVRRFNPDDIPPGYRDAVEHYFENLSRNPAK